MDDSAPSDFRALMTRQMFRIDPWIQRAFEAQAPRTTDEDSELPPHVPEPGESIAEYKPSRITPMTTARWHQWTDLPEKARSVVSTAEATRYDWMYLAESWNGRHRAGITRGAIQSPSRKCVILVVASGRASTLQ
jgi:hypothetical protein